jgi:acylphosphatase
VSTGGGRLLAVDVVRYRVTVSGRVQGVWYRQSCQQQATMLRVGGWIRNNADGTVEAAVEGDAPAVDELLAWMRTGPRLAQVTTLALHPEPPQGARTFSVQG